MRTRHEMWEFAYFAFLRVLALFFIVLTIQIWMLAIGLSSDPDLRFDTMPSHWRLVVAILGILHPVTTLGLWGLFSWGIAVWLMNIAVQLTMHLAFAGRYGYDRNLVIFHLVCFAIFVIFQLAMRFTLNKS